MAVQRDADQPTVVSAIQDLLAQFQRDLNTAIPATIESYDAPTRRATVQPAIYLVRGDELVRQAPVANVPVMLPSMGGYTVSMDIETGDPVMLIVSQRDMTRWKERYVESAPGAGVMVMRDAVAIPGFGPRTYTPANEGGIAIQSDDGSRYVRIESDGTIEASGGGGKISISADGKPRMEAGRVVMEIDDPVGGWMRIEGNLLVTGLIESQDDIIIERTGRTPLYLKGHRHLKENVPPIPGQTGGPA